MTVYMNTKMSFCHSVLSTVELSGKIKYNVPLFGFFYIHSLTILKWEREGNSTSSNKIAKKQSKIK